MDFDGYFDDRRVNRELLRKRSFNSRWAEQPQGVLPMTAADCDFPIAPAIGEAVAEYLAGGLLSYGPAAGFPSFRAAVARTISAKTGLDVEPAQIVATDSAATAVSMIARFGLAAGDEIILLDPIDSLFQFAAQAVGAVVRRCSIDLATGLVDLDGLRALVNANTKMIGICNPHNPSGVVLTAEQLRAIGEIAVEHGLWILNDEVWSDIVYSPVAFVSISTLSADIASRTLTAFGFSKSYGLAGLRIGYVVAPSVEIAEEMTAGPSATTASWTASTLSQVAAQAALEQAGPWLGAFRSHLHRVRDAAVSRLQAMPGVWVRPPEGTYLLFPNISSFGMTSLALSDYLKSEALVALVAGEPAWFGPGAEGHVRVAFATSMEIAMEAMDRIEAALGKLG